MGAYLSQPKTDKISSDENSEYLAVGSSSMQGWRNSQEDAHNAILNFDTNASFFAVYDGHGGAEVATYCADKFPEFLKKLQNYKGEELDKALKEAFLGFDKTLLEPQTIEILKVLAGEKNFVDPEDSDEDEDIEDLAELHEESHLPLNEVLEKMANGPMAVQFLKKESSAAGKPQSPYLRGRRAAAVAADAANKAALDPDAKPQGSSTSSAAAAAAAAAAASAASSDDAGPSSSKTAVTKMETDEPEEDSTVSSSSSSASKLNAAANNNNKANSTENAKSDAGETKKSEVADAGVVTDAQKDAVSTNGSTNSVNAADSSHAVKEVVAEQNGSVVTSSELKAEKGDVSTTANASSVEDITVSGSSDAPVVAGATKIQNGTVGSTSAVSSAAAAENNKGTAVERSAITSSTSGSSSSNKENNKQAKKASIAEDDSTDDDADYDAENSSTEDNDASHDIEFSSEEEIDADEIDEDDAEDEAEDEEDEDEDEDEEEDEEDDDEDEALANEQFCANMIEEPAKDSGCTAVVALLKGRDLYVANAGDSRCVVCRNGKSIDMSLDHKPEDDEESARILKAGGRVTLDGRVNGGLNLSRAIGDHAYKMNMNLSAEEQMISALPDIKKLIVSPNDEFMILACDGIWNFMSSEEVVDFVRIRLKDDTKKLSKICEELFDNCLAPNTMGDGTGCDNMTAVIVRFQPKILELPTKINPAEAEDVNIHKHIDLANAGGDIISIHKPQPSLKRIASPTTSDDNSNEAENVNKIKRLKTDGDDNDDEDVETKTSSSIKITSITTNTTTITDKSSSSSTTTISTTKIIEIDEKQECDTANSDEIADATLSST